MKVIDLKERTIYVDDIQQIYCDNYYYTIQTTHGRFYVDSGDYFKVKEFLLSLNDEKAEEIVEEKDKEIERLNKECDTYIKIAAKKENIIKEVRKKIYKAIKESELIGNGNLNLSELLEILDKE